MSGNLGKLVIISILSLFIGGGLGYVLGQSVGVIRSHTAGFAEGKTAGISEGKRQERERAQREAAETSNPFSETNVFENYENPFGEVKTNPFE